MKRKNIFRATPFIVLLLFFIVFAALSNNGIGSKSSSSIGSTENVTHNSSITTASSKSSVYGDATGSGFGGALAKAKSAAAAKAMAASKAASSKANFSSVAATGKVTKTDTNYSRKIILSGNLGVETTNFDVAIKGITQETKNLGGFIASSNITGVKADNGNYLENREATYTIRIPSSKFDEFVLNVGTLGIIVSKTSSGEDITSQYYDSTARLNSQRIKEARLLDILKKTKTLSDVLALETELENTRYQIENLTGTLKMWDDLVQFSTINLTLTEVTVKKPLVKKPITLGDRIHDSFKDSINSLTNFLKTLLVDFIAFLPYAVILIIVMVLGYFIYLRFVKKKS